MNRKARSLVLAMAMALSVILLTGCDELGGNSMKKGLISYTCSTGGDMIGSSRSETIKKYDDTHAIMTTVRKKAYYAQPEVSEYFVDIQILSDLEDVYKSCGMNHWNNKKFTNVFVADGPSTSYRFSFEDDSVYFSSQIYPDRYRNKLDKLDEVIKSYTDSPEPLPGLITEPMTDDELYAALYPRGGELRLVITAYYGGYVYYNISNGTDENAEFQKAACSVESLGTGEVYTAENAHLYATAYKNSIAEESVKTGLLPEGTYRLTVGELSCDFTIGF